MTLSCSAWMVATMSPIRPVRAAVSEASNALSPLSSELSRPSRALTPKASSSKSTMLRPLLRRCRRAATAPGTAGVAR